MAILDQLGTKPKTGRNANGQNSIETKGNKTRPKRTRFKILYGTKRNCGRFVETPAQTSKQKIHSVYFSLLKVLFIVQYYASSTNGAFTNYDNNIITEVIL